MQEPIVFLSKKNIIIVLQNCLIVAEKINFRLFKLKIMQGENKIETQISIFGLANFISQLNPIITTVEG